MNQYREYQIRTWEPRDRVAAAVVIQTVLAEYGLGWEPEGADRDVIQVEECYRDRGGEFWVVEFQDRIVGTAAYYPIERGEKAVEIRKMYLLPQIRGQGLGKYLLHLLEHTIALAGYREIWIETASILTEAVALYENQNYQPTIGVETARCDRVYRKLLTQILHQNKFTVDARVASSESFLEKNS